MRVFAHQLAWVFVCALMLGACGGSEENDCEKATVVRAAGIDEACSTRGEECCICHCWHNGNLDVDNTDPCTCIAMNPEKDCAGNSLDGAKACLRDEIACRQAVMNGIDLACPSI